MNKFDELLQRIPEEFRPYASNLAYNLAHAYGEDEIYTVLQDLVNELIVPAINEYNKNHPDSKIN